LSELDVTAIVFDEKVNAEVDLDGTMSVEVYLGVVPSPEGVDDGGGGLAIADNGDGTLTLGGNSITDNLDGTLTLAIGA
jgi:hypothetical protein